MYRTACGRISETSRNRAKPMLLAVVFTAVILLAGCGLTEDEARQIAAEQVQSALSALPTPTRSPAPTPQPQPTPQPTATPIVLPPTATPQPTATPILLPPMPTPKPTSAPLPTPTPLSLPGLAALIQGLSGTASIPVNDRVTLRLQPGIPLGGRDTVFSLTGLDPWGTVTVEHIDPRGQAVDWVRADETLFSPSETQRILFADASGALSWTRVGAKDGEGVWSLRLTINGEPFVVSYQVSQFQLPVQRTEDVGVELRRYQGSASDVFYSIGVPSAVVVDLQAHLSWIQPHLATALGVESKTITSLYLAGSQTTLAKIAVAVEAGLGLESGMYKPSGKRPGIYLRTDFYGNRTRQLLTHEFVHKLLHQIGNGRALPAWLNEGIATYYEYDLGLRGGNPAATQIHLYETADRARFAAVSGAIFSLTSLESQTSWNARTKQDDLNLQYAEAYMAVRYFIERFGASSLMEVMKDLGAGSTLTISIPRVTGSTYQTFQDEFATWLKGWDTPERMATSAYIDVLNSVAAAQQEIRVERANELTQQLSQEALLPGRRERVNEAQSLLDTVRALEPPESLSDLHGDAVTQAERFLDWLSLELRWGESGDETTRERANAMLPEIGARRVNLERAIVDVELSYSL
ncbi:MAG: hypothetical protein IIC27_01725 [Chloroflexi bacterium]|nr:hypothetical protein [Chloroflexota bacterium]